jgi:[acyl-carrier-protein] S-malonyltransferase
MKRAYIFPGQGAQYIGMGVDFAQSFASARAIFEQADDILERRLSKIIFDGPEDQLTETKNSQVAIYVTSMAILAVIEEQFPEWKPAVCAGLSLGEYSAVTASGRLPFDVCLPLVQARGQFMNDACEATDGTMAAIIGLDNDAVISLVEKLSDVGVANLNCPKQVVISGTPKGIESGINAAKEAGARKAIPLQVHGAFHSRLMAEAERRLEPLVAAAPLADSDVLLVMNVAGDFVSDLDQVRALLVQQVTRPVRWEAGIRAIEKQGVDLYLEIGCGKTLSGMNKRIGVEAPTLNIEKVTDLDKLGDLATAS